MSAPVASIPVSYIGNPALYGYPAPLAAQLSIDMGPETPSGFFVGYRYVLASKGDSVSEYRGGETGHYIWRDRDDVDANSKGVGYALSASVVPKLARNNVPIDDVACFTMMNRTGMIGARGTDCLYVAHNEFAFPDGLQEFGSIFVSEANANKGLVLGGILHSYAIDLYSAMILSGKAMRIPAGSQIVARDAADQTDRQVIGMASDESVQIGAGWPRVDVNPPLNIKQGGKVWGALQMLAGFLSTRYTTVNAASYVVGSTETNLTFNGAGCTVTLPPATGNAYRELWLRTTGGAVVSASANVVALAGGGLGTAILPATPGAWVKLVCDTAQWQMQAAG